MGSERGDIQVSILDGTLYHVRSKPFPQGTLHHILDNGSILSFPSSLSFHSHQGIFPNMTHHLHAFVVHVIHSHHH